LQPFRQLLEGGIPVSIRRKVLDLLSVLARAEGDLVTKDELMAAVWPSAVVEDNALQVHIASLRKLLCSNSDLLTTVHGLGYRLAATPIAIGPDCRIGMRSHMNSGRPENKNTAQPLPPVYRVRRTQQGHKGDPNRGQATLHGELNRLARTYENRAVLRLAELMHSTDESVALLASQAMLDIAHGGPWEFIDLSPDELKAAEERRLRLIAVLVARFDAKFAAM
jgi:DNA-binding winged helix-turn-helix (wHTH) protein